MAHLTRREVLAGSLAGAIGLGLGASGASALNSRAAPYAMMSKSAMEAADSLDSGTKRYGSQRVIWSVKVTDPVAAITFDDGPDPHFTPRILAALDKAEVKATFNVMGHNGVQYPSLLKEVVAAGHELGNHTWSHEDLAFDTEPKIREQIVRCKDEIEAIIDAPLLSFRPPRGKLAGSGFRVCAELGYDVYVWSVARGSKGVGTPQKVADFVSEHLVAGDVLGLHDSIGRGVFNRDSSQAQLLHDRREVEVQALPQILQRIADKGITLVPATVLSSYAVW